MVSINQKRLPNELGSLFFGSSLMMLDCDRYSVMGLSFADGRVVLLADHQVQIPAGGHV